MGGSFSFKAVVSPAVIGAVFGPGDFDTFLILGPDSHIIYDMPALEWGLHPLCFDLISLLCVSHILKAKKDSIGVHTIYPSYHSRPYDFCLPFCIEIAEQENLLFLLDVCKYVV